jgi:hypothetical protein
MKKVQKVVLVIGLIVFAISVVACAIDTVISAIHSNAIAQADDIYGAAGEWFWIGLNVVLMPIPFLLSELSLIRNACLLLTEEQPKARNVFYIISSLLALLVIVMVWLVKIGCFEYRVNNTILLTLWPSVIVSFLLGGKRN